MRYNRVFVFLVSFTVVFALFSISPTLLVQPKETQGDVEKIYSKSDYITHSAISIIGDSEFSSTASSEGWLGNGSSENPYIIEGYYIYAICSIGVYLTSVHFIIRGCYLEYINAGMGTGCIGFVNVTNAVIRDNVLVGNSVGMYLSAINNCMILNNTYTGSSSDDGLILETDISGSYSNIIANNTFTNVHFGITIDSDSTSNIIEWNYLDGSAYSLVDGNPTEVNTIQYNYYEEYSGTDDDGDGIGTPAYPLPPYYSYSDLYPLIYPPVRPEWVEFPVDQSVPYGPDFFYDLNVTSYSPITWWVNDSEFSIDEQGIITASDLEVGTYDLLVKVTNIYGRYLVGTFQVSIYDTELPTWVIPAEDQSIMENEAFDYFVIASDESGFSSSSINATFLFNLTTAEDNEWILLRIRNITPLTPGFYPLNLTISDNHANSVSAIFSLTVIPLDRDDEAPLWLITPEDQFLDYDEPLEYVVAACDSSGIDHWTLNESVHFVTLETFHSTGSTCRILNSSPLLPGAYPLELSVFDTCGNMNYTEFVITVGDPVTDTEPPIWIVPPIDVALEFGEPLVLRMGVWDDSGIYYWWVNNSASFFIDSNAVLRNYTALEPGEYPLEVRVYDIYNNYCFETFTVTVSEEILIPTRTSTTLSTSTTQITTHTTSTPTSSQTLTPTDANYIIMMTGAILGAVSVTIIVIIVILGRKLASR